jgi:hypothetical protein
MHLRAPSVANGTQAFLWAALFFLVVFFGGKAVGITGGTAFILGLAVGCASFLFIRARGGRSTTGEL